MRDLLAYANRESHYLEYAISLASKLDAQLEGVVFAFLPELSGIHAGLPGGFFTAIQEQSDIHAEEARRDFLKRAKQADIRHGVRSCTATAGEAERIFGRAARCFDLAIVPQTNPAISAFFSPKFEDTMFISGRPALFVPTIHRGPAMLERILLCWNGDRSAARAAADALPLMKLADSVDVLQIELESSPPPECHADEIIKHLDRHNIRTRLHVFGREDPDIGAAILSFAADRASTLVVMGGYGHARMREVIFGGATREILQSMTIPVLMSH